jgi:hypothetical protein
MSKPRSSIYDFFEFVGTEKNKTTNKETKLFKCLICGEVKKGHTTSNLITHLETKSKDCSKHEEAEIKFSQRKNETIIGTPIRNSKRFRNDESQSPGSPLLNFFQSSVTKVNKYGMNSSIQKERASALLNMLTKCMLPISLVENKEFTTFLNKLDPYFNVPTAKTVTKSKIKIYFFNINHNKLNIRTILDMFNLKNEVKCKVKNVLKEIKHPNVVLDIWSDATMRSFLGSLVQGISDDWRLVKVALDFKFMRERHFAVVINNMYQHICCEYGIIILLF